MGKEFIVEKAICICKYGESPGILVVTDQQISLMNGKLTATTMTLGNVFQPPGFGMCKMNPMIPRPCAPAIAKWSNHYEGMSINNTSFPLTDKSKGTCARGAPDCVEFIKTGQIPIPGPPQIATACAVQQLNLDPLGSPFGLTPEQEDYDVKIK